MRSASRLSPRRAAGLPADAIASRVGRSASSVRAFACRALAFGLRERTFRRRVHPLEPAALRHTFSPSRSTCPIAWTPLGRSGHRSPMPSSPAAAPSGGVALLRALRFRVGPTDHNSGRGLTDARSESPRPARDDRGRGAELGIESGLQAFRGTRPPAGRLPWHVKHRPGPGHLR